MYQNGITGGGGYDSPQRRCREARAMTAFEWFAFAAFAASWVLDLWSYKQRREMARSGRRGVRGV